MMRYSNYCVISIVSLGSECSAMEDDDDEDETDDEESA